LGQEVRLQLLGPPQVRVGDRVVEQLSAKTLALLAYLSLVVRAPRERLIGLLWAESDAEAARKNLRNTLWLLRRALGEDALQASGDHLALHPAVWADTRVLERLAVHHLGEPHADGALDTFEHDLFALSSDPLLDGVELLDAPDFELWLTTERERLNQTALRLLQQLIRLREARHEWPAVVRVAQRALTYDPLQEAVYRSLMTAYARSGDRAQALRQYDVLRAALERELGVEPLPETEAVRAAILAGAIGASEPAPSPAPRHAEHLPMLGAAPPVPFVGRQHELALLDRAFAAAQAGRARAVLITGEAGIGKTRLWEAWSAHVSPAVALLTTSCTEALCELPLLPLAELLRNNPAIRRLLRPGTSLAHIWLAELGRLLPELRAAFPELAGTAVLPAAEERLALFEALVQCIGAQGEGPAILFIDDLHWADSATLDWLAYALRRMQERPLLLIATYRLDEAPADLVRLATQWSRSERLDRLPLGPLDTTETTRLLDAHAVDPALHEHIQARSAGNPYFAIELARVGADNVPHVLAELIRRRLERLPAAVRQIVQAAQVLQPEIDVATLRRTSGRSEEETLDALDTLVAARVLEEQGGRYAFTHPLLASVVRDELSAARQRFLHRRAAEAVEALHPAELAAFAGRLTHHYSLALEPAQAAHYAELAGEQALSLAAPREALQFYTQALQLEPTLTRQLGLARSLERSGDLQAAITAYEVARARAEAQGERSVMARASLGIADASLAAGQVEAVVVWARRGLSELETSADRELQTFGAFLLGAGLLRTEGATEQAAAELARAADLAASHRLTALASRSQFELGNLRAQGGDLPAARQCMDAAIALAQTARAPFQETLVHNNAAYYALLAGDLTDARAHLQSAQDLADAWALDVPHQWLASTWGELALAEGRWDEAESWFQSGKAVAEGYLNRAQVANYNANLGQVARGRGDLEGAIALLERARGEAGALGAAYLQAQIDLWLAEAYLAAGARTAAASALVRIPADHYPLLQPRVEQVRRAVGL
jgi:DNA-binding SARP family transcriptional activator/tetratricopeptide (TPR) repeat protein